jgi:hypothetical protein
MSEYLSDPNILGVLLFVLSAIAAIALVMMLYLLSLNKKKLEESVTATSDWQPTGKIDFYCAETPKDEKSPASFLLRVEASIFSLAGRRLSYRREYQRRGTYGDSLAQRRPSGSKIGSNRSPECHRSRDKRLPNPQACPHVTTAVE